MNFYGRILLSFSLLLVLPSSRILAQQQTDIDVLLRAKSAYVKLDDAIPLEVAIHNPLSHRIAYSSHGEHGFKTEILDETGKDFFPVIYPSEKPVYGLPDGSMMKMDIFELGAGKSYTFNWTLRPKNSVMKPGKYKIRFSVEDLYTKQTIQSNEVLVTVTD